MDGQIIAGRFIQEKAKGGSGKVSTHLVNDPLSEERLVVKVFAEDEPLVLEYLKAMNILEDHGCRGMVLSQEGGMLEDEPGFYQVFPEVHGPTLEEFLSLDPSMEGAEVERLVKELEDTLHDLHAAGYVHLFLAPRNVFFSPGRPVLVKDPALTGPHYSLFLQELQGFDYSFFSPRMMDGGDGAPEDDFYSLGRLILHLLDRVEWAGDRQARTALLEKAEALTEGGADVGAGAVASDEDNASNDSAAFHVEEVEATIELPVTVEGKREEAPRDDRREGESRPLGSGAGARGISLEGLALSAESRSGGAAADAVPRRKRGRAVRAAVYALAAACALAVLVHALPAGSEGRTSELRVAEEALPEAGGLEELAFEGPGLSAADFQQEITVPSYGDGECAESEQLTASAQGGADYTSQGPESAATVKEVTPPANRKPVASFTASPSEGASPLQVYLDASSSYDPDGDIVSYQWSCGGSGTRVYRVFESGVIPARVSITLTVTDNSGATASAVRVITLY